MLAAASFTRAETCSLELKRLEPPGRSGVVFAASDYLLRATYPQHIFVPIVREGSNAPRIMFPGNDQGAAAFKRIVTKEPKYACDQPVRGVFKLGSRDYAFALDYVPPKEEADKAKAEAKSEETKPEAAKKPAKDAKKDSAIGALSSKIEEATPLPEPARSAPKATPYNRLYFDFNHNGDLTDDKPVEALPAQNLNRFAFGAGQSYVQLQFPRIDVTLDVEGTPVQYAFFLQGMVQTSSSFSYASISLNAAAYREGDITLEGKKRHVVLLDFNSNGRFDDEIKINKNIVTPNRQLYPEQGDRLLIDPNASSAMLGSPYDITSGKDRFGVAKLVNIDDKLYDMKVSPAGDRLTLTPSSVPLGKVTNPHGKFHAVIYGDQGFLQIHGEKGAAVPVPEGEWKLLSYTIDMTGATEPSKPEGKPEKGKPEAKKQAGANKSLIEALAATAEKFLAGSVPAGTPYRNSVVSAQATAAYKAVTVSKDQTVELPFGPPYKPEVTGFPMGMRMVDKKQRIEQMRLQLSLVGSAGEICTNMTVDGGRPAKPKFTITDPKGEIVEQGNFEYG
jgi:hypothetical protein